METQNLVISFDTAECRIMKFHYRNSSNTHINLKKVNIPCNSVTRPAKVEEGPGLYPKGMNKIQLFFYHNMVGKDNFSSSGNKSSPSSFSKFVIHNNAYTGLPKISSACIDW